jgi:outer membrane biosynthesis protein TonB
MTDSRAAVGLDRLPWLDDEPRVRVRHGARDLAGWAVAATMLVAGVSYWTGTRVGRSDDQPVAGSTGEPAVTVNLPQPQATEPQVRAEPVPEVRPAPSEEVSIATPRIETTPARKRPPVGARKTAERAERAKTSATARRSAPKAAASPPAAKARPEPLTLWPARQSQGAKGRIVRIGAFGSRYQAKLGWQYMRRAYPAVGRLPAVVVDSRNSRGRTFYRFQIGTTSQAHSEVLCQRMQRIHLSCAVVGLSWKPQGVER